MPLTGIEIFKLLPKTNCGDCGVPTCLAFAMSLAQGKAELSACPHVSDEAKEHLSEASAPPIRAVAIGTGDKKLTVGGETVMFRHEKRFEHPCGLAILISDSMDDAEVTSRLKKLNELTFERIGLNLHADLAALKNDSGDAGKFAELAKKAASDTEHPLILMSDSTDAIAAALAVCGDKKPLIYAATKDNADAMAELAKKHSCPLAVKAANLDELAEISEKLSQAEVKDIVLDSGARQLRQVFQDHIIIRSAALNNKFRPLGFPTIVPVNEMTDDPMKEALYASILIAKYAGILVLSDFNGESLFNLLVERLNIYTDPQRPLMTEEGIYEIGNPDENSPILITTNFSLTYFIVAGEIESSRVPSWLLVMNTDGLSVMTAWAAGTFVGDNIATFVKKSGIMDKVKHKKLILPGYIAMESGGVEDDLGDWEVMVGPREAAHLPAYLKAWKA